MRAAPAGRDPRGMNSRRRHESFGLPSLLLVTVVATVFTVLLIALIAVADAGWVIGVAMVGHMLATAAVMAATMKMLGNADRAED